MKRLIGSTLTAAAIVLAGASMSSTVMAESYQAQQEQFRQMDKNDDGKLMLDELDASLVLAQNFDTYDVDDNGSIELDEFYDYVKENDGKN